MMLSDVPNFAFAIGYTNASWTLKVDLVCDHLCRLLAHMDLHGLHDDDARRRRDPTMTRRPLLDFAAGYVQQRSTDVFPKQGSHGPWTAEMATLPTARACATGRSTSQRLAVRHQQRPRREVVDGRRLVTAWTLHLRRRRRRADASASTATGLPPVLLLHGVGRSLEDSGSAVGAIGRAPTA